LDGSHRRHERRVFAIRQGNRLRDIATPARPKGLSELAPDELASGSVVFTPPTGAGVASIIRGVVEFVRGANWKHPQGPGSSLASNEKYPVFRSHGLMP